MEYVLAIIVVFSNGTWIEAEQPGLLTFDECNEAQSAVWMLDDPHLDAACIPVNYEVAS